MAAVLFELLDLVLCYFWPFCLSCGSVLFVFVHHCDIGCCFQSFDFDQIGGRLAIFLKKNRFLKRFLFAFKQIWFTGRRGEVIISVKKTEK